MHGLLGQDNIWPLYNYLNIWSLRVQKKYQNIDKITFKVIQIKLLYYSKIQFSYIYKVGHLQNIFMEHDLYLISEWFLA